MDILIDTFSWKKFDLLAKNKLFEISNLYEWSKVHITHEILTEIKHFRLKSCNLKSTIILPVKNIKIFQEAIDLDFDQADAEVLSNGTKNENLFIVSEDKPLLQYCQAYKFKALQLVDLFHLFTMIEQLENRDLYRIVRFLRNFKNITEKKSNHIKKWLKDGI